MVAWAEYRPLRATSCDALDVRSESGESLGDMSVAALLRLLEAAGFDLKIVKAGHTRTLEDILAEQRRGDTR